jgi:hypothetical protein
MIDAMKQAVEALEWGQPIIEDYGSKEQLQAHLSAKDALYKAIEEAEKQDVPEQEKMCVDCGKPTMHMGNKCYGCCQTTQPEQEHKPWCDYLNIMLTSLPPQKAKCNCKQAEKQEKLCKYCGGIGRAVCDGRCMPEQEPVSWAETNDLVCALLRQAHDVLACASYPFKRPWVGLTEEEIKGILDCGRGGLVDIKKAEQILREKNT